MEIFKQIQKKREKIEISIEKGEWQEYFRTLLEGKAEKSTGERRGMIREDRELRDCEIKKAIKKAKKKKAGGIDGITNEAWLYGGRCDRKKIRKCFERGMGREGNTRGLEDGSDSTVIQKRM